MRIWDVVPADLCAKHLLGEHRELHAIWSVIVNGKKGYSAHPETKRWEGKLRALYSRHQKLVAEMTRRGYKHNSELNLKEATGADFQNVFINSVEEQIEILKNKPCDCYRSE